MNKVITKLVVIVSIVLAITACKEDEAKNREAAEAAAAEQAAIAQAAIDSIIKVHAIADSIVKDMQSAMDSAAAKAAAKKN